jgi:hypothetical protein
MEWQQFYKCFIKNCVAIMAPITKLTQKKGFRGQRKVKQLGKQKYIQAPILIPPNWDVEFHVHTYASLLVMGVLLA